MIEAIKTIEQCVLGEKTVNASYELWFRAVYRDDLTNKEISAAVRPGDRRFPRPKSVQIGEIATIRIILRPGSEEHNINPLFGDLEIPVEIIDVVVKPIGELSDSDLALCSQDARSSGAVKIHLEKIYRHTFSDQELVTVIHWRYLEQKHPMNHSAIRQLIEAGVMSIGTKAKNNPDSVNFHRFASGIANKDYPAQTPFLWNSVYQSLGMRVRNVRLFADPKGASKIFEAFRYDSHYIGGDVGVGYKDRVLDLLDEIDPLAKVMGAINVVVKTERGLKGYNTDGYGFTESLKSIFRKRDESIQDKKVVLLGAGGTANAIAFALAAQGAEVTILNRTVAKAEDLSSRVNEYFGRDLAAFGGRDGLRDKIVGSDAVVSIIDDPHSDLDRFSALAAIELPATAENISRNLTEAQELLEQLPKTIVIADVMLRNSDTATIAQAKAAGFETVNGLPMVLNQAIEAFYLVNEGALVSAGFNRQTVTTIMQKALST
jgi:shikimate dehydrogenase